MPNLRSSVSLSVSLGALLLAVGCGSDSSSGSDGSAGETSAAGAAGHAGGPSSTAGNDSGGSTSEAGEAGESSAAGESAGAASAAGAGMGGAPSSNSPCSFAVSGGDTFPTGDPTFLCLGNSRLLQKNGSGDYDILFTSAFPEDDYSSNFACSISSATPPAAGATWVLGAEHKGVCNLSKSEGLVATLWKAASTPVMGDMTLKFVSASLQHGTSEPKDVYYLFDVTFTGNVKGETQGAPDVKVEGHFQAKALPPGN